MINVKRLLIISFILIFFTNIAFASAPERPEPFGIIPGPICQIVDR